MMENTSLPLHTTEYWDQLMDPDGVTKQWVLFTSPMPVLSCLTAYLLFILKLGPAFMEQRKPFKLENIMRFYNLAQVILNAWCLVKSYEIHAEGCLLQSFCDLQSVQGCGTMLVAYQNLCWMFLVLKITDLLDTVFMVLRKKQSHVTVLHVYHHVAMVLFCWFTCHYYKSPQGNVAGVNFFVHTVMYGYYFLATFPTLRPYLWWKRHLTKLQLGQFVSIISYLGYLYLRGCAMMSPAFSYIWIVNVTVFCGFFIDFYIKAYIKG